MYRFRGYVDGIGYGQCDDAVVFEQHLYSDGIEWRSYGSSSGNRDDYVYK